MELGVEAAACAPRDDLGELIFRSANRGQLVDPDRLGPGDLDDAVHRPADGDLGHRTSHVVVVRPLPRPPTPTASLSVASSTDASRGIGKERSSGRSSTGSRRLRWSCSLAFFARSSRSRQSAPRPRLTAPGRARTPGGCFSAASRLRVEARKNLEDRASSKDGKLRHVHYTMLSCCSRPAAGGACRRRTRATPPPPRGRRRGELADELRPMRPTPSDDGRDLHADSSAGFRAWQRGDVRVAVVIEDVSTWSWRSWMTARTSSSSPWWVATRPEMYSRVQWVMSSRVCASRCTTGALAVR